MGLQLVQMRVQRVDGGILLEVGELGVYAQRRLCPQQHLCRPVYGHSHPEYD